ncbi:exonuclease domain-containing protein (plasmid) [Photobacterium sp. GJ3]|uniref:3'-5' exonuclease n=1 Tax=Photobacterium sp. GJ3 TaxID=2829502 RepID=UPI001B8D160F|nr:3'-5' exonuclease [Photobacterium sp. GJ3]QUJ70636.1 exonuclease domain-containing protein [Photobacterium sp. GJ3]
MNYTRIVCFDLEMCCWNEDGKARTGEIIEIGVAELNLEKGTISRRAQYFVQPESDEISPFCTELTGIKPEVVAQNGKPLASILKAMEQKFGGRHKIYAAWGRDDAILRAECKAKGLEVPFREYLNLATLFKLQPHVQNKRIGLRAAMAMSGLEWEGRQHSGYVDAYNLARLARMMFPAPTK